MKLPGYFGLQGVIKLKINMYYQNATSNRSEREHFSSFKHLEIIEEGTESI